MDDSRRLELLLLLEHERLKRGGLIYLLELRELALSLEIPLVEMAELTENAASAKPELIASILKREPDSFPRTRIPLLDNGEVRKLEDVEAEVIRFAITYYNEQMSEVARRLEIGRSTLYRKLEGLGFPPRKAPDPYELA